MREFLLLLLKMMVLVLVLLPIHEMARVHFEEGARALFVLRLVLEAPRSLRTTSSGRSSRSMFPSTEPSPCSCPAPEDAWKTSDPLFTQIPTHPHTHTPTHRLIYSQASRKKLVFPKKKGGSLYTASAAWTHHSEILPIADLRLRPKHSPPFLQQQCFQFICPFTRHVSLL